MAKSVLEKLRDDYHKQICEDLLSYRSGTKFLNIADKSSKASVEISDLMVAKLPAKISKTNLSSQTIGQRFTETTKSFVDTSFRKLGHLRPGDWIATTSQAGIGIAKYDQYEHLAKLDALVKQYPDLKSALGGDYLVIPDIIIARKSESDQVINLNEEFVGASKASGSLSPLRVNNFDSDHVILHASISCKWTIRSDRAQNTRTEALNLIRNRKGKTPQVVAVTFEPLPTRLASICLGTGDLDCTYHVALHELQSALSETSYHDQSEMLNEFIEGRRLRDIGDLPLDLAV